MTPPDRPKAVREGEIAPEFVGTTASGESISRASLLGHRTVLFFYPKAGSPGCSMESREFARLHAEFTAAGATVVGVSVDPPDAQRRFQQACELPFDLVADHDRSISARFGVLGRLGMARRTTFVLGADGRILRVIRGWRPGVHAREALEVAVRTTPTPADEGQPSVPPEESPRPRDPDR